MLTRTPATTTDGRKPGSPASADGASSVLDDQREAEADSQDVQATLRRRVLSPQTLVSFGIAIAVIWFVVRRLDIDPAAIWVQIKRANLLFLAIAFVLWYGAFFVR